MGELTFNHVYGQTGTTATQTHAGSPAQQARTADPAARENPQPAAPGLKPDAGGLAGHSSAAPRSTRSVKQGASAREHPRQPAAILGAATPPVTQQAALGSPEPQARPAAGTPPAALLAPGSGRVLRSADRGKPAAR